MPGQDNFEEKWLPLNKAAQQLGVHASTLRRWADDGEIPFVTTAGGHRRFSNRALQAFLDKQRGSASPTQEWASRALSHARADIAQHPDANWLQPMDAAVREQHRIVGRKLMGLTLQCVSADDAEQQNVLAEAHLVGREYGELSKSTGVPLRNALEAALFFRDRLLEATWELPAATRNRGGDNKIDRRINALLNTVQLAVAEVYES
jgi:excisionase family DNA binding protein